MKAFETPIVDVKKFDVMDVLTTSGEEDMGFIGDDCVSLP